MRPKHTPGPWHIQHRTTETLVRGGKKLSLVALLSEALDGGEDYKANAALIAAAPALLNACRFVLEYHAEKQNAQTLKVLRAAIAKATGQN